jgi:hypothetical protein
LCFAESRRCPCQFGIGGFFFGGQFSFHALTVKRGEFARRTPPGIDARH